MANFIGPKDTALLPYFADLGCPPRRYGLRVVINGLPGAWKSEYPRLTEDADALYAWLAGYFGADGDIDRTGRPTLSSSRREHLQFVRLACQRVGIGTFGIRRRTRSGIDGSSSDLFLVGLMRRDLTPGFFVLDAHRRRFEIGREAAERRGWNVVAVRPLPGKTDVFGACAPSGHAYTLTDNILVGDGCDRRLASAAVTPDRVVL